MSIIGPETHASVRKGSSKNDCSGNNDMGGVCTTVYSLESDLVFMLKSYLHYNLFINSGSGVTSKFPPNLVE